MNSMDFKHYLFDWGDTLMVDQPDNPIPMSEWKEVFEVKGATDLLALLNERGYCHLATNSFNADERQIRKALTRVGISRYIKNIYCYRTLGLRKPDRQFFDYILGDLGVNGSEVVMIGDGLEKDVIGALDSGIQAIWFNPKNLPVPENIHAIDNLLELMRVMNPSGPTGMRDRIGA